ncbi:mannose-1-phosphate guanylyltransferase/mannose-6-phosphate isomerase [Bordetella tumulicola]|uniref:mannose-1-phosphate guanylyltransferase/mannose-6-phosphate isomerase n=1 Tax=Bordetella tumulicola TaxID=1649133 RepID=UPI0039EF28D2
MLCPVIIAGGAGTRLWPASRQQYPKQFLNLEGSSTMLQATLGRLKGLSTIRPTVICNEQHRFLVAEQLRVLGISNPHILLEPEGRNTAPAIALAALEARMNGDDPLLLVLAADHLIRDIGAFHAAINTAIPIAEAGRLVTFGIVPERAETGYGYIQRGEELECGGFGISRFFEKPSKEIAEEYLESGDYFWNSGMFMFRAGRYLEELEKYCPEVLQACQAALSTPSLDSDFIRITETDFLASPNISIDYAVMEHTTNGAVVPLSAGWSDIGSWQTLWQVSEKDSNDNVLMGDVIALKSKNNLIRAEDRLVSVLGVDGLVVVETKDAVLVTTLEHAQNIKEVVAEIKNKNRSEHLLHREVYRPWGSYDSISNGDRYQVKKITVKPGAKLSVQMHHHRAEHWVVVSGTAKVTKGENTYLVSENQSTYISIGEVHALENPGKIPLHLIEIQSGTYLAEDDIVRFEDKYGRV